MTDTDLKLRMARWLALACLLIGPIAHGQVVEIVVEPGLWATAGIPAAIGLWRKDVARQGYDTILTTQLFGSPEELRAHLAERWRMTGLDSVLLVGDIPSALFEREEKFWEPALQRIVEGACNMRGLLSFETDRFYTDLDGVWEDRKETWSDNYLLPLGSYDFHGGHTAPEISLGRINPSPLKGLHPGRTEAQMVIDYFKKVAEYRRGETRVPMGVVNDPSTSADEFKALLATPWEHLVTTATGSIQVDRLSWPGDPPTHLWNYELAGIDPQGLFVNLATQWTARDCGSTLHWYPSPTPGFFAGELVFGEGSVLLAIASQARSSMTQGIDEFYGPLAEGVTFGEALRQYLTAAEDWPWHVVADVYDKAMIYGMTIIGDPTLMDQGHMPFPGDANLDGALDLADLAILADNWQQGPCDWSDGDFTADKMVDLSDLIILAHNWGNSQASVPEPCGLTLLLVGFCISLARRRATPSANIP